MRASSSRIAWLIGGPVIGGQAMFAVHALGQSNWRVALLGLPLLLLGALRFVRHRRLFGCLGLATLAILAMLSFAAAAFLSFDFFYTGDWLSEQSTYWFLADAIVLLTLCVPGAIGLVWERRLLSHDLDSERVPASNDDPSDEHSTDLD